MPAKRDYRGRFGRLTVLDQWYEDGSARVLVRCDCGTEKRIKAGALASADPTRVGPGLTAMCIREFERSDDYRTAIEDIEDRIDDEAVGR